MCSSATAEDLPNLSFAGQQETFLNVIGVKAVQAAAKRCWGSLWAAQAIGYQAIVVQAMAPAEAAGIMFTANPINSNRQEIVINAAWGLGQAIVSGQVSPDTIIANKATGQVVQVEVAEKTVMTIPTAGGTTEQAVADSIHCLACPRTAAPHRLEIAKGCHAAMRNNIVELMANPLTPLLGSLGRLQSILACVYVDGGKGLVEILSE